MSESFELDHRELAVDPAFAALATTLERLVPRIDSAGSFNRYCREACRAWRESHRPPAPAPSAHFNELLARVWREGSSDTIRTGWGGVVVTLHEPPRVEKFLVVREGGYLALEKHELKDEHLEVREGGGLLLSRRAAVDPLTVGVLTPGGRFHFAPGMEHCIIGTENLLVFERSTDPKGMDQDLIFLYEPDAPV